MHGATTGTANMPHSTSNPYRSQLPPGAADDDGILNALYRHRWDPYSLTEVKKAVHPHALPAPPPPPQHADPTACIPSAVLDSGVSPVGLLPSPSPARHHQPTNANDSTLGRGALQDLTPDVTPGPHLSPSPVATTTTLATVLKRLIEWHWESPLLATKEEQRASYAAAHSQTDTQFVIQKGEGHVYVEAYFPEYGHARPSKAKKEGAPPALHPPWNQIAELLAKGVKTRVQAERPGLYGEDGHHRSRPLVVVHIPPFKGTRPSVDIAGYSSTEGTYRLVELRFGMFVKDRRTATTTTTAAAADGQEEGSDEISYLEGVVEAVLKGLVKEVVVAPA